VTCHTSLSISVVDAIQFPCPVRFMRAHQLAIFQLHVPLRAGPRFFVPPISRKQKWTDLIDDLAADFVAFEMSMFRNKKRCLCRRPKPAQSNASRWSLLPILGRR